jgi:hypothetical protein
MHYAKEPGRYFHIRDWDVASRNASSWLATGDYTHLAALGRHYDFVQTIEGDEFLRAHERFLVWNDPEQKWFEW